MGSDKMNTSFGFTRISQDKKTRARTGIIHTPHGDITTPAFVPVGTQATVKSLTPEDLKSLGVDLFFVNTYHMFLRPGIEVIKKFGGLHRFMHWDKPLITDSGGFQVFSLARDRFASGKPLATITEKGVTFQSHWDGSTHTLTPEISIRTQHILGADIMIAFDDCTPYPATHEQAKKSMDRTHRWAIESLKVHKRISKQSSIMQALYGVVHGSTYEDLRRESAQVINSMDFDGIAIGGVAVGERKKEMVNVLDWTVPLLSEEKPRHLLGVGEIDDIFALIERGMDTFDCVQPTRLARMGAAFTRNYPINKLSNKPMKQYVIDITKNLYAEDIHPLDTSCHCYTCQHFSRAYIHHLFRVKELLAYRLTTIHNIHFVQSLVSQIRGSIIEGTFLEFKKQWLYNKNRR
jgi:queuine tRNA-ribosyltransferase